MDFTDLKTRLSIELLTLVAVAIIILTLFPQRPSFVDLAMALLGLLLLSLNFTFTKNVVWGQFLPNQGKKDRIRGSIKAFFVITSPLVMMCLGAGLAIGFASAGEEGAINRIFNPKLLLVIAIFIPWALLQQTLFQFYLLGRLLTLLPTRLAIICTGITFGLVHLPDFWLTLTTALIGIIWTYLYYRYRLLSPLALSHAILGSTFFYWVYGYDVLDSWTDFAP